MSETKHTPGPWETLTFSNHELQTDFAMVKVGRRVHMVGHSEEDEANARLIAAAPDLLDLVRMVYLSFGGGRIVTFGDDDIEAFAAAIAKATGEQQ